MPSSRRRPLKPLRQRPPAALPAASAPAAPRERTKMGPLRSQHAICARSDRRPRLRAECEHPPGRLNRRRARRHSVPRDHEIGSLSRAPVALRSLRRIGSYGPGGRPNAPAMPPPPLNSFQFPVDDGAQNHQICRDSAKWSQPGSNRRPPACKAGALPTELWPRRRLSLTLGRAPTARQADRKLQPFCGRRGGIVDRWLKQPGVRNSQSSRRSCSPSMKGASRAPGPGYGSRHQRRRSGSDSSRQSRTRRCSTAAGVA